MNKNSYFISHRILAFSLFVLTIASCVDQSNNSLYRHIPSNPTQEVVLDHSNLLSNNEKELLANLIVKYESESSNEIAILTVDSINPYKNLGEYAMDVGNSWGVGKKERSNGLLIVVVQPERKVWLATGDGTQNILTDSICSVIIQNKILPKFKNKQYFLGLKNALDTIQTIWY